MKILLYGWALFFLISCSSPGNKNVRPFEKFEEPKFTVETFLKETKGSSRPIKDKTDSAQLIHRNAELKKLKNSFFQKLDAVDNRWFLALHKKRKKFETFQRERKSRFSREQKETRQKFIADKPSRDMLGDFLSEQATSQREYYLSHQDEMLFFDENEAKLKLDFKNFKKRRKSEFEKRAKPFVEKEIRFKGE